MIPTYCPNPNCPEEQPHVHGAAYDPTTDTWSTTTFHPPRGGQVLDAKYLRLLVAARVWRAGLIPKTSTGLQGPTSELLAAIEALD